MFLLKKIGIGITCKRCVSVAALRMQSDVVDALTTIMLDSLNNALIYDLDTNKSNLLGQNDTNKMSNVYAETNKSAQRLSSLATVR
jgi:hypothetical protein